MADSSSLVESKRSTLSTESPDPSQLLLQFATGYVPCAALWVAAELKIADLIGSGSTPVAELARRTDTHEDALFRVLRLLAMLGIFTETEPRHFSLTLAAELLRSDHPQSARDTVLWLADPFHFNIAAELLHSVQTGQPTVEHVTGKPAFEYFSSNQVEFDRFHRAMTNLSALAVGAALKTYDFSPFKTIVDIGGGHGFAICSILQKYPHLNGVLFDLKDIVPGADECICEFGLQGRCRTAHGDFFQSVPEGGDLYFMKHILHDWTDEQATTILRNCRRALDSARNGNAPGKVVLLEFVVPPGNQPHPSKLIDIEMLFFPGGRERMEQEWRTLFAGAGFRLSRIIPTESPFSVIEAEVA
ncbi:MAG TPA: methyltransferase [Bryobacteraceae bacterium]|nr:methyltransferase [Bryobacteraceae bacterium]